MPKKKSGLIRRSIEVSICSIPVCRCDVYVITAYAASNQSWCFLAASDQFTFLGIFLGFLLYVNRDERFKQWKQTFDTKQPNVRLLYSSIQASLHETSDNIFVAQFILSYTFPLFIWAHKNDDIKISKCGFHIGNGTHNYCKHKLNTKKHINYAHHIGLKRFNIYSICFQVILNHTHTQYLLILICILIQFQNINTVFFSYP